MSSIKKGITSYGNSARSSFDYSFVHHAQAKLLCNDLLTKTIDLFRELATAVEYLYHQICLQFFGSISPNKEARATCWNIVTTLIFFNELLVILVVPEDVFNHPDRSNEIYLWGVSWDNWVKM